MQPVSTSDSGFIPRKEFIRDQRTTSHFSLLAISGSSFIRLYSFPSDVIAELRRLFDHFYLNAAFREDVTQKLCEFQLHGKPWASPKSSRTERILLDIIAVIYKHGYSILSTIDYGRERDDRLAISFSRPSTPFLPVTPNSPVPAGSGSNLSHGTSPKSERKMPFAISFISSTVMRVIYPPLNSTPAILQAVRGSWPRGVVSEKKVGDAAYEFKLKGYSWFNEDTFATDSLHQILSLLTSLDAHACSMVTSLSINGHSRVKDLWLFTGPGSSEAYDPYWPDSPVSQSGSMLDVRRSNRVSTSEQETGVIPSSLHRRVATAPQHPQPFPLSQNPAQQHHTRAATETNAFLPHSPTLPLSSPRSVPGNGMRKPAPRAQVPVSVDFDAHDDDEHDRYRTSLPSAVPSSCENMTGVGTANRNRFTSNLIYTAMPGAVIERERDDEGAVHSRPDRKRRSSRSRSPSPHRRVSALRPVSTRSKTPPLLTSNRDPRTPSPPPNGPVLDMPEAKDLIIAGEHPPLLSPGMFRIRDSAFSSKSADTTESCEVPIKWTGLGKPEGIENIEEERLTEEPQAHCASPPPTLPGGWTTTPELEQPAANNDASETDENTVRPDRNRSPDRSLHDVDARVDSPELVRDEVVRKSEAGMIGMVSPPRSRPPPLPLGDTPAKMKAGSNDPPASPTKAGSRSGSGSNGWVLVNLDHTAGHAPSPLASPTIPPFGDRARRLSTSVVGGQSASTPVRGIPVIDRQDGKGSRGKPGSSGLRRLLSFSRTGRGVEEPRNNNTRLAQTQSHDLAPNGQNHNHSPARSGRFRNKLARLGPSDSPSKPPDRVRVKLD